MQHKNYDYDFYKSHKYRRNFACSRHIEENAEYIEGQQRHNQPCDNHFDYIAEVAQQAFECASLVGRMAQQKPSTKASTSDDITVISGSMVIVK